MSIINSEFDPSNSLDWLDSNSIIFLRHGHSTEQIPDFVRTLSNLGREECQKTGIILSTVKPPILTLCSVAKRCVETVNLIEQFSGHRLTDNCKYINELYLAPSHNIKRILKTERKGKNKTLIVGHNPGMSDILNELKFKQASNTNMEILATCGIFICDPKKDSSGLQAFDLVLRYQYSPIISKR